MLIAVSVYPPYIYVNLVVKILAIIYRDFKIFDPKYSQEFKSSWGHLMQCYGASGLEGLNAAMGDSHFLAYEI